MRLFLTELYFSCISETSAHKGTDVHGGGGFNILHMLSMSPVSHSQEHGNLYDWKSRPWLWSRFMTFCGVISTYYSASSCINNVLHVEEPVSVWLDKSRLLPSRSLPWHVWRIYNIIALATEKVWWGLIRKLSLNFCLSLSYSLMH